MGFKSGVDLVKPFGQKMSLRDALSRVGHARFAVDVSGILHRKLSSHASRILDGSWKEFDDAVEAECGALKSLLAGVSPVFVFDGRRADAKRANSARRQAREKASGDLEEAKSNLERLQQEKLALLGHDADGAAAAAVPEASAASSDDARLEQLGHGIGKAGAAIRTSEKLVAAGQALAAAERTILVCRRRGFDYVVAPGEAEHQMRSMQSAGSVGVVCGYDTDFFAMGCASIAYGQTPLRDVLFVDWDHADQRVIQSAVLSFTTGTKSDEYNAALTRGMRAFGVRLVVQLSALFLQND